jgi:hypothetical protein
VKSLSEARRRGFLARFDSGEADLAWGVLVNFALHVMRYDHRGLVFADSARPVYRALSGNEEKSVTVTLGTKGLRDWASAMGNPRRPLNAWFKNHIAVLWGKERSFSASREKLGLVAINDISTPSTWAFHLAHNRAHLASSLLVVARGGEEDIAAFVGHLEESFPDTRSATRPFGPPDARWALCLCQVKG